MKLKTNKYFLLQVNKIYSQIHKKLTLIVQNVFVAFLNAIFQYLRFSYGMLCKIDVEISFRLIIFPRSMFFFFMKLSITRVPLINYIITNHN